MKEKKDKKFLHHQIGKGSGFTAKFIGSFKQVVFGLEDGVVSTLGALTGIAGGVQNSHVVILSGFVIIFVESLSMAAGTFLSEKSDQEVDEKMLQEQRDEIRDNPEEGKKLLRDSYMARGFSEDEITILMKRVTADSDLWLEEIAHKELGIIPHKDVTPKTDATFMGVSYIVGGSLPLASYFFLPLAYALPVSVVSCVVFLFFMGYVKGKLVSINKVKSGLEMMLVSLSAAGLGYIVGSVVGALFDIQI